MGRQRHKPLDLSSPPASTSIDRGKGISSPDEITSSLAQMEKEWHEYMAAYNASLPKNNASEDGDTSWISSFCSLRGNGFFCQVDRRFIKDDFNRCHLDSQVPYYANALSLILDKTSHNILVPEEQLQRIKSAAKKLYGLIHARYILTKEGMDAMLKKFNDCEFERCPRASCSKQACLPVGESDIPEVSTVKIYCPQCKDIYNPRNKYRAEVDGAYFGTTFPHLFLMTHEHLKPKKESES